MKQQRNTYFPSMSFRPKWRNLVIEKQTGLLINKIYRFHCVSLEMTKGCLIILLLCLHVSLNAQQLTNPSFEGQKGAALIPYGWMPYAKASSPDTQPGFWGVTLKPSHGRTYMSMVCRGFSIIDSDLWENCIQPFNQPLIAGETYHYSVDLAFAANFIADTITFNKPANFRVWGMNEMQQKELLWESGAVSNTYWKTFYFELKPTVRTPFLILEAYYTEMPKYCGNILIDNIQYYPLGFPLLSHAEDVTLCHTEFIEVLSKDTASVIKDTITFVSENDTIPTQIDGREVTPTKELVFKGDKLTITVWDHRTKDGDVISLFLNEKTILKEFEISKERLSFDVAVKEGVDYYLTLYAHNLGEIPPNTVALYISDGIQKKFITLSSDLEKCEALKIKIEHELVKLN